MRDGSPSGLNRRAVPLSKLQGEILLLLAAHRDPESYVAGSTYLTRSGPRISGDIDIFHDREDRVARAAEQDAAALQEAGMHVRWQRREPTFFQAPTYAGATRMRQRWRRFQLHTACESSQRQRRAPTLAQGNALGLHRQTNPSPERARQCIRQLWIGLERPFRAW
jgi:hypothetical protein